MALVLYRLLTLNPLFVAETEALLLKEIEETDLEHEIDEIDDDFA